MNKPRALYCPGFPETNRAHWSLVPVLPARQHELIELASAQSAIGFEPPFGSRINSGCTRWDCGALTGAALAGIFVCGRPILLWVMSMPTAVSTWISIHLPAD